MNRLLLVILDGWALNVEHPEVSAIAQARTPVFDELWERYAHTTLITWGEAVGLPPGQMGNSEVGHLNIGAGRIVWQDIMRIYRMIQSGELEHHPVIQEILRYLQGSPSLRLHLMGLTSTGGVHSHVDHLRALVEIFHNGGLSPERICVHAFTDGRDTEVHQARTLLASLEKEWEGKAQIVSVIGRYYAMDRDRRWERTYKAYAMLVHGTAENFVGPGEWIADAIDGQYQKGITDEFLRPIVRRNPQGQPIGRLQEGDVVFCFNFRKDRCRQLCQALFWGAPSPWDAQMPPVPVKPVLMTRYDRTWTDIPVILEDLKLPDTWGEWLSAQGCTQLRIAETEKYPHVTYFFSGGREEPFPGEERILVPSPRDVPTYDRKPEMSAPEVTEKLLHRLDQEPLPDFVCLNFANPDMVGHTGVMEAAIRAVETVDTCLGHVLKKALARRYTVIVTADHGNADIMKNPDGTPHTAHTKNPVPFVIVHEQFRKGKAPHFRERGILADIAPTGLALMRLPIPSTMEGNLLVEL